VVICLKRGANDLHMVQLADAIGTKNPDSRMVYLSGYGLARLS